VKSKIFCKKLILNKKTIADLNNKEMKNAAGGMTGGCQTPACLETTSKIVCCLPIQPCANLTSM
jgi:hypothetical protein